MGPANSYQKSALVDILSPTPETPRILPLPTLSSLTQITQTLPSQNSLLVPPRTAQEITQTEPVGAQPPQQKHGLQRLFGGLKSFAQSQSALGERGEQDDLSHQSNTQPITAADFKPWFKFLYDTVLQNNGELLRSVSPAEDLHNLYAIANNYNNYNNEFDKLLYYLIPAAGTVLPPDIELIEGRSNITVTQQFVSCFNIASSPTFVTQAFFTDSKSASSDTSKATFIYYLLPKPVPTVYCDTAGNKRWEWFGEDQLIQLEGSAQNNIQLYVAADQQVEALQIFNPEFMQTLLSMPPHDFLLRGQFLIMYSDTYLDNEEALQSLFNRFNDLYPKVSHAVMQTYAVPQVLNNPTYNALVGLDLSS